MLRVVLDPGVIISALISDSPPARVFDRWREGEFDLLVSDGLLAELQRVLMRNKFRRYLGEGEARALVEAVRRQAVVADDPVEIDAGLTPDPGDDYLLAFARVARADLIVSGDAHLTELADPDPPVMRPREFLDRLERG